MGKLRAELEDSAWRYFHAPAERERIRSVLVDLSQTALAFTQITHKALEQLSSGIAPRLRQAIVPSLDLTCGSAVKRPGIHPDHSQGGVDIYCAIALAGCKVLCGCGSWTSDNPCSSAEMRL